MKAKKYGTQNQSELNPYGKVHSSSVRNKDRGKPLHDFKNIRHVSLERDIDKAVQFFRDEDDKQTRKINDIVNNIKVESKKLKKRINISK